MAVHPLGGAKAPDEKSLVDNKGSGTSNVSRKGSKSSPFASTSDISEYKSAPQTPLVIETPNDEKSALPASLVLQPIQSVEDAAKLKARQIFDNTDDDIDSSSAAAWMGEDGPEREHVRNAYMELFDWSNQDIIDSLRGLCDRIVLKGETQQMDRMMVAFAERWCECNPTHLYRSSGTLFPHLLTIPC
jgi:Sec7-like guanine-nucleotide exchange factor